MPMVKEKRTTCSFQVYNQTGWASTKEFRKKSKELLVYSKHFAIQDNCNIWRNDPAIPVSIPSLTQRHSLIGMILQQDPFYF